MNTSILSSILARHIWRQTSVLVFGEDDCICRYHNPVFHNIVVPSNCTRFQFLALLFDKLHRRCFRLTHCNSFVGFPLKSEEKKIHIFYSLGIKITSIYIYISKILFLSHALPFIYFKLINLPQLYFHKRCYLRLSNGCFSLVYLKNCDIPD